MPRRLPVRNAVVMMGALSSLALACSQGSHAAPGGPPAPAVTVAAVEARPITEWDEWSGRFEAVQSVEIRPRVSGHIQKVAFAEGKEVKADDVLFVIDPRPYRAELARAEGALAQARSASALAGRALERSRPLAASQAISREDFDNRTAAAEGSAAGMQAAEAALAIARLNLEWTQIRSPISGRVGRADVTLGNLVQAGAPARPLTTVVSLDPIYVTFDADERSYLKYAARARGDGAGTRRTPINLGLSDETGFPHQGQVDFFDNQIDPRSGTIRARAVFSNKDRLFTPGLFARLKLESSGQYQATVVADRAVGTDQDKKFVLVLKDDSTVEYRAITLGRLVDGYRVVTSGLKPGERIVVNGLQRVRPGMKVTPSDGPMLADASGPRPGK